MNDFVHPASSMLNTYRASQRNYPSGIYQEQIHIIFYDHFGQSKFSFHSVMYPGMIVSISHSRILGLSFFHSLPFLNFGSGFFCSTPVPKFWEGCFFHSPLVLGLWEWNYAFPLTLGMTSINTFPPLRAHLYSQKCYGKLEKSKDRFLFPYFSLSYPLDKCQRRRLLILNSVKCEMCRTYSPNMSEQG